jgi:uncharacterized membrane protein
MSETKKVRLVLCPGGCGCKVPQSALDDVLAQRHAAASPQDEVSAALEELREMFPRDYWIRIDRSVIDQPAMSAEPFSSVTISIDKLVDDFEAPTLEEAVQKVREWKDEKEYKTNSNS